MHKHRGRIRKSQRIRIAAVLTCTLLGCGLFTSYAFAAASLPQVQAEGGARTAEGNAPKQNGSGADMPVAVVWIDVAEASPAAPAQQQPAALAAQTAQIAQSAQTAQTAQAPAAAEGQPAAAGAPVGGSPAVVARSPAEQRHYDITLLAKLMWGEARGINSEMEKAAVAWCALNRVASDHFAAKTVEEAVTEDAQFSGYHADNPVLGNLYSLAEDVYNRWSREQRGHKNVGRVLPEDYCYFWGDGKRNYFVNTATSKSAWTWRSHDPYPERRKNLLSNYSPSKTELEMIAQVIWHTARNVKSECEQAAVVWCIFNRVQSGLYPDTVKDVIEQDGQFSKIDLEHPIHEKYFNLASDVAKRWQREMNGEESVGRVLPANYLYFYGNRKNNVFFQSRSNRTAWRWTLTNPYTT